MSRESLPENLRLLCSYTKSITNTCQRLGMNRQQFNKYLSGKTQPSLQNLRRIADYFGLEETELLLDHKQFREIVTIKRPVIGKIPSFSNRLRNTLMLETGNNTALYKYIGYYYSHYHVPESRGLITRSLMYVYEEGGFVFSRNFERYPDDPHRVTRKFSGIWAYSGDKVCLYEREDKVGKIMWMTILSPNDQDQESLLLGLSMGVSDMATRDIFSTRVILKHLGKTVNYREALKNCGRYSPDDPHIDKTIRIRIKNEIREDESCLLVRQ